MKVLVTGGRDYKDGLRVVQELTTMHRDRRITHVIHGGANGADRLADEWAKNHGVQPVKCEALWEYHRRMGFVRKAGYERNKAMLALNPDVVLAFPGGRGTEMQIDMALRAGIEVIKIA
jgi:hypothetical protein